MGQSTNESGSALTKKHRVGSMQVNTARRPGKFSDLHWKRKGQWESGQGASKSSPATTPAPHKQAGQPGEIWGSSSAPPPQEASKEPFEKAGNS